MSDFLMRATLADVLENPARMASAVEDLIADLMTHAPARMRADVAEEYEARIADIGKGTWGITHVLTDRDGTAHPARPAFFQETWLGKERLIDAAWLIELRDRADKFWGYFTRLELALYDALEDLELMPGEDALTRLRIAAKVYSDANQLALDAAEMLERAERYVLLLWFEAAHNKKPFRRCGGELPALTTISLEATA
ncbi:hypothetical protein NUL63_004561 [Salmonella enterica]|nr:hypothetical protein [Salmonella enterica]